MDRSSGSLARAALCSSALFVPLCAACQADSQPGASPDAGGADLDAGCGAGCGAVDAGTIDPIPEGCTSLADAMAAGDSPTGMRRLYAGKARLLAREGDWLYFVEGAALARIPVRGGDLEIVRDVPGLQAYAVSGDTLTWLETYEADFVQRTRAVTAPLMQADAQPVVVAADVRADGDLVSNGSSAFWPLIQGGIMRASLSGSGELEALAPEVAVQDLVVAGEDLYVLDFNSDSLLHVAVGGGGSERLTDIFAGGEMAMDQNTLYWADGSEGKVHSFELGSSRARLLGSGEWPVQMNASNGRAYWYAEAKGFCYHLYGTDAAGNNSRRLLSNIGDLGSSVADASGLLVSGRDGIYHVDGP